MKKSSLFLALLFGSTLASWAGAPTVAKGGPEGPPTPTIATCVYGNARADLDINNVRTLLFNGGDMWWDLASNARYEVPRVDDPAAIKRHSLFGGSIWVSGRELGTNNIYVMAQTFRTSSNFSFWPGPIDNLTAFTTTARCQVWDKMFKINRSEIVDFEARYVAGLIRSINDIPGSILRWPAKGNPYLRTLSGFEGIDTNYELARFIDRDGNGIYDPLAGDSPRLPGREAESSGADQCVFWVMNDVGNVKRFNGGTVNNRPIGMEIQTEAFAYATSDYVNDMTFYRQKLINKGTTILEDCYFAQWADPDLGFASDDYVQFNVPRGLAICYNGDDFDEGVQGYGSNPPSVAIDFFKGPAADPNDGVDNDKDGVIDESGELIIASNFVYYNNSDSPKNGDPRSAQDYYNYMRSIWRDNTPVTYDLANGTAALGANIIGVGPAPQAKFIFPGASDNVGWGNGGSPSNPRPLAAWSEENAANGRANPPGDRRFLTNAGAFTLRPGAVNELTIGVVWARTTSGGPTGSFNKLLAADDAAQKLFDNDFKILDGPDAPDVEITELDGELLFTIIPKTTRKPSGELSNTETYQERDFNARLTDPFYRFEGYLVYQFADGASGFGDLDNPDKAKLIANVSSDLRNGVSTIINQEFDEDIGDFQPRVKVRGTDKGLVRTFSLNQDFFSGSNLTNFRRYFYTVLAYGYNGDSAQQVKYIQGRNFRRIYSAVPHKVTPEQSGTVLNSVYNQSLDVTRIQGIGNSGVNYDSLVTADEIEIVKNGSKAEIKYANGKSPVQVRVYNPKKVVGADLKMRLYSRVSYIGDINAYNVGDVIISSWQPLPTGSASAQIKDPILNQKPGMAIVKSKSRRVGSEVGLIDLEVEMLNDGVGGRFTSVLNLQDLDDNPKRFINYVFRPEAFFKQSDPSVTSTCTEFEPFDYWRLYDANNVQVDSSSRPLTVLRDQLATRYGLLISVENKINPGEFVFKNLLNGLQESTILYADRSKQWITPIPAPSDYKEDGASNWWRNANTAPFGESFLTAPGALDIAGTLRRVLDGSFASYGYVNTYTTETRGAAVAISSGAAYPRVSSIVTPLQIALNSIRRIGNVDIVLTSDKSQWTRCVVIQADTTGAPAFQFAKSRLSSVNADYQPTGEVSPLDGRHSRGMSYFPGYAIDLDKGIRLNVAFMESRNSDTLNGNNLKWEPTSSLSRFGGKNYIYVFPSKYDSGRSIERRLDSIQFRVASPVFQARDFNNFWSNVSWVGRLATNPTRGAFLSTKVRIRLRVDKSYASYPDSGGTNGVPTYGFTTNGLQPQSFVKAVGKSALDLVRVVPNPYYAYSSYEQSQVDNRVRITNLPTKFTLSIYTISGSLIRQFRVDNSTETGINRTTFQDWDLKTQTGLPIASGAYIMHIDAFELGQKTVKWFGIMRPTDLDAISN